MEIANIGFYCIFLSDILLTDEKTYSVIYVSNLVFWLNYYPRYNMWIFLSFSALSVSLTPPSLAHFPPTCLSHNLTRFLVFCPRGSSVWLLWELWFMSGQVPRVDLYIHCFNRNDSSSLPSFFSSDCAFLYDASCIPSWHCTFFFIILFFFYQFGHKIVDMNINQVTGSHKSRRAPIHPHIAT